MADIRDIAFEDYKAGMSLSEIATKHNLKPGTVRQWARRYWKEAIVTKVVTPAIALQKKCYSVTKKNDPVEMTKPKKSKCKSKITLIDKQEGVTTSNQSQENESKKSVSRKVRREKTNAKDITKMVLAGAIPQDDRTFSKMSNMLQEMGLPETELNMQTALIAGQVLSGAKGNYQAAQLVLSLVGEDPLLQIKERGVALKEAQQKAIAQIDTQGIGNQIEALLDRLETSGEIRKLEDYENEE